MGHDARSPADIYLRPPSRVAGHVRSFCAKISAGHAPVWVQARRMSETRAGMCFNNVQALCSRHGGSAEFGWLIWEWEDTYIEAEHHSVWCLDGERIEVTPRHPHHERVLFLPDPGRAFDFKKRRRLDNIRMPLRSDANVREYLALAARGVAIEEASASESSVGLPPDLARALDDIWLRMRILEVELAAWSLRRHGRNAPCWCGSGRKLKRCHNKSRVFEPS